MNLANFLTFSRIFISPIFLFIYLEYEKLHIPFVYLPYILIALIALCEISDACDGYFARKYNQVTDLGKILDPMADSIYRTSIFLTFTLPPIQLPMILIFVFLYRDAFVSTLRTICALRGYALAARPSGKLKAGLQAASAFLILLLLIPYSHDQLSEQNLQLMSTFIVLLVGGYTLFSGLEYMYANRQYVTHLTQNQQMNKQIF